MSNSENFNRGARETLPESRKGFTQKMLVDGVRVYIRTGEYSDGRLAEFFIDVKEEELGKEARAFINNFGIAISIGLQHGVPLKVYMEAYCFEDSPSRTKKVEGVDNVDKSVHIIDAVFQTLRATYCPEWMPALQKNSTLIPSDIAQLFTLNDFRPK